MRIPRTVTHILPWALVAAQAGLIARLLKSHQQIERLHSDLRERLVSAQRDAERLTGQQKIAYHAVTLKNGQSYQIAVDELIRDPISRAVAEGERWFLDDYNVLLHKMQPGDRVLDLGGHIGTFALAAATLGCEVGCVEAAPANVALLHASVARNGFEKMRVIHGAVTDYEGTLRFVSNGPWGAVTNSAIIDEPTLINNRQSTQIEVPALTVNGLLKSLGWNRVDWIKMDIEGSECAAINGMTELLARPDAPALLYEANGHALHFFGHTPAQLTTQLHDFGYTSYELIDGQFVPRYPGDFQGRCVVNCLALKESHRQWADWQITPRTAQVTMDSIIKEVFHNDPYHRIYIARALAEAPDELLADPKVQTLLRILVADANTDVRAAAAWFNKGSG